MINRNTRAARIPCRLASALVLCSLICVSAAAAGPANPTPIVLAQPDGTRFAARVVGDEWANGHETFDGYAILSDRSDGYWKYADQGADGTLVLTPYVVTRDAPIGLEKGLRAQPPSDIAANGTGLPPDRAPALGSRPTLVILVQFSDRSGTTTPANWQSTFFGATNSVKHHYRVSSYNQMTLTPATEMSGTFNDGIVGWVTLIYPHPNTGATTGIFNQQLTKDAILAANPYVDFGDYDTNHDAFLSASELMVVVVVAGNERSFAGSSSCSPSVWGHKWDIFNPITPPLVDGTSVGGGGYVQFGEMHCQTSRPPAQQATIGVIVHEMGHLFGLPDLYDTDLSSEGIGDWSLMAAGLWGRVARSGDSPSLLDPWSKAVLGWVTPTLVTGTLDSQILGGSAFSSGVYQFLTGSASAGTGEYFLVENRQQESYDASLPGAGLLIWHVEETQTTNKNECIPGGTPACSSAIHYKVALVQADNAFNLERDQNSGDTGDPFPGSTNNLSWNGSTFPNSRLWGGATSSVTVTNIFNFPTIGMVATFSVASTVPPTVHTNPASAIGQTSATLNGTVNPNGTSTTTAFDYGTTTSFGSSVPAATLSGSASQGISVTVSLSCGTQYFFQARGTNTGGTTNGGNFTLTTLACLPILTTNAASAIGPASATLNGTVNPNGTSTTTVFDYGTTIAYLSSVSAQTRTGSTAQAISASPLLACGQLYHFRARGTNAGGTTVGSDLTFTTLACPVPPAVTTNAASGIGPTSATLNGTVNPSGLSTITSFDFGTTGGLLGSISAQTVTGSTAQGIFASPVLSCGRLYSFRARGASAGGTTYGSYVTFTTAACPAPTVITNPPNVNGPVAAYLFGTANPNGAATMGHFEYGLTTSYGLTTLDQPLGSGTVAVAIDGGAISGLTCGTSYHTRAVATNSSGTSAGLDAAFTTMACPPPAPFDKAVPINGVTNQSPTVQLWWVLSLNATGYDYCLDTSNNDLCDTSWVPAGSTNNTAIGNLAPSTTYYWQMRATNSTTETAANAGTWWSFTTQAFRSARLIQPSPSVRLPGQVVAFAWDRGLNVVQYSLFIGSTPGAGDIHMQNEAGLSRFVGNLPVDGRQIYVRLYSRIGNVWVYRDDVFLAALASSTTFDFGVVPMRGDYDGDGVADLATWWGVPGMWQIVQSSTGYTRTVEFSWGRADQGDRPVMGDFDGDGKADPAVWRAGSGLWLALLSSTNYRTYLEQSWGRADLGDVPVPADFDGDGKTDPAIWRRGSGYWYALQSSTNYAQYLGVQWGREDLTDRPVPGDYDGDAKADPAVWRAATGEWLILRSSSNYANYLGVSWGRENETDQAEPADYDGDGRTDIAIWRRSTGFWHQLSSSTNFVSQAAVQLGNLALGDRPVPGRFSGNDLKVDPAVWRGSTGGWIFTGSPASPMGGAPETTLESLSSSPLPPGPPSMP